MSLPKRTADMEIESFAGLIPTAFSWVWLSLRKWPRYKCRGEI